MPVLGFARKIESGVELMVEKHVFVIKTCKPPFEIMKKWTGDVSYESLRQLTICMSRNFS